jgi:hypothetical protein
MLDEAVSPHVERVLKEMEVLLSKLNWEYFYGRESQQAGVSIVDEATLRSHL